MVTLLRGPGIEPRVRSLRNGRYAVVVVGSSPGVEPPPLTEAPQGERLTDLETRAGWTRAGLQSHAEALARLGFSVVRVCRPLDDGTCDTPGHRDRKTGEPCENPGKRPIGEGWNRTAETDPARVRTMTGNPGTRGYGVLPPPGVFSLDVDGDAPRLIAAHQARYGLADLPKTRVHRSGAGWHYFFRWPSTVPGGGSGNVFHRVVTRWLPLGMTVGPGSVHAKSGRLYTVSSDLPIADFPEDWARTALEASGAAAAREDSATPGGEGWTVSEGRHTFLVRQGGRLRNTGLHGGPLVDALQALNRERCVPPKPEEEVRDIASWLDGREDSPPGVYLGSGGTAPPPGDTPEPDRGAFPGALHPAALYGLPGAVVATVDPYTEADPAAILFSFLVAFGAEVGNAARMMVGAEAHAAREYVVLVGRSAKARKGSSWPPVRSVMAGADPFFLDRVVTGLGSGEGLIAALAREDPEATPDPLVVYEPEFARVLKVSGRDGSTLSPILRDAWDRGDMSIVTRKDPLRVRGAHIGVLGHITEAELRRDLHATETLNGFGNRFLWVPVRRSKLLPEPPPFVGPEVDRLTREVRERLAVARRRGVMERTAAARELWAEAYAELSRDDRHGLAGALTARAEAHVLRLSLIYALADGADRVRVPHLLAAVACWEFLTRAAGYLFGSMTGDPLADDLEGELRRRGSMTRTDIRDHFGRHRHADRIGAALDALERAGKAKRTETTTGGRPAEVWTPCDRSDQSDQRGGLLSLLSLWSHRQDSEPGRSESGREEPTRAGRSCPSCLHPHPVGTSCALCPSCLSEAA